MRFIAGSEVVSAATDSTLRLWDVRSLAAVRNFSGHTNEKNFVGLSVDQDFIACGSETNEARASLLSHAAGPLQPCHGLGCLWSFPACTSLVCGPMCSGQAVCGPMCGGQALCSVAQVGRCCLPYEPLIMVSD